MKVKIKTWDKMVEENKLDQDGDIKGPINYFMMDMEKDMPADRIIEISERKQWIIGRERWNITVWMIETSWTIKEEADTLEKIIGDL